MRAVRGTWRAVWHTLCRAAFMASGNSIDGEDDFVRHIDEAKRCSRDAASFGRDYLIVASQSRTLYFQFRPSIFARQCDSARAAPRN